MSLFDFNWYEHTGTAVKIGDITVVPQSKALQLTFPYGGFVWNRPYKVFVQRGDAVTELPIVDETWRALIRAGAMAVMITAVVKLLIGGWSLVNGR